MSDTKISALSAVTSAGSTDTLPVVQSGTTKKATVGNVLGALATTKGDIYGATTSGTLARLGVGSNGQVLTADSTQSTGLKWSVAAGRSRPALTSEIVAYYLDESASPAANSGSAGSLNLTDSGVTFNRRGPFSRAVVVDGVAGSGLISGTGGTVAAAARGTLNAWIRPDATGLASAIFIRSWAAAAWASPFATIGIATSTGGVLSGFISTGADGSGSFTQLDATGTFGTPTPGQWSMVSAVYDGTNFKLYINAVQIASTTKSGNLDWHTAAPGKWVIGRLPTTASTWAGAIADCRFWDAALTVAQLEDLYASAAGFAQ